LSELTTDEILTKDEHLIQSFADLNGLKQNSARTAIVAAKGAYVTDSEGNQLIDGIGGLWCVNVGHGRTEIIDAIAEQLRTLDYYSTFYNNDTSIRILHHYNNRLGKPGKKKILSRMGAYHGSTHLSMALTTPVYSEGWDTAAEGLVHHLSSPCHYHAEEKMTEAEFLDFLIKEILDTIHNIGAENICAFIAEPIMGAGGILVAPDGYHKRMREITTQHDIKYIADEVVTAFGRLGHMFASEEIFGMVPDIINTAKGLTSGYQPMAATIINEDIYEVISAPGALFQHGMTYSGHPAAAAAALANIEILESEGIPQRVQTTGKVFENALRNLTDLDIVGEVRGSHFMMGIEFIKNKDTKEPFTKEDKIGLKISNAAQRRGLIARPCGNILILSPTLIMDEKITKTVEAILRESIIEVTRELSARM